MSAVGSSPLEGVTINSIGRPVERVPRPEDSRFCCRTAEDLNAAVRRQRRGALDDRLTRARGLANPIWSRGSRLGGNALHEACTVGRPEHARPLRPQLPAVLNFGCNGIGLKSSGVRTMGMPRASGQLGRADSPVHQTGVSPERPPARVSQPLASAVGTILGEQISLVSDDEQPGRQTALHKASPTLPEAIRRR
jgi:hypothetical protein